MNKKEQFDFWYAVNNTEIVMMPTHHLETFGTTMLNYHIVSELMDSVDQVRIREGRMQANQPKIITPQAYSQTLLEGFGEEAQEYIEWLKDHEQDMRILQYGYKLRQEAFSEHTVTDNLDAVVERVKKEVEDSNDPLGAVVIGVDVPWDVCLIKLFWQVMQSSAGPNIQEMQNQGLFNMSKGLPHAVRAEIEDAFLQASRNPDMIKSLSAKLQYYDVFTQYQDRFFALVKASKS